MTMCHDWQKQSHQGMPRAEPPNFHAATAFREYLPGNLQPDARSVASGDVPESWAVVYDIDNLCISIGLLSQRDATVRAPGACRVGQDIGERPPQARAVRHYIPWCLVLLLQNDLWRAGQLL